MKVALISDLHLEFHDCTIRNSEGVDTLIMAGDICVAHTAAKTERIMSFFESVSKSFNNVIYVLGNHEYYNGDFKYVVGEMRNALSQFENIHILQNECITIEDYTFLGTTLWTDFNKKDPMTLYQAQNLLNDYRTIKNSNRMNVRNYDYVEKGEKHVMREERPSKFMPEDALNAHLDAMEYISSTVKNKPDNKYVIVGHHAPSTNSIHPRYEWDGLMNGNFMSDLSEFILDAPQIKLWVHGHMHDPFDYMIGDTRVVCNPRGYPNEKKNPFYEAQVIEL